MPKIVRVGGYKDFTVMENDFLRDMALDIPERGLLATMLSLPEDWDFSGIGLTSILPCGKTKVFNNLKKLETAGYLKRNRIYVDGKVSDWEYLICGRPVFRDGYSEDKNLETSSVAKSKKTATGKSKKAINNPVDNFNNSVNKCVDNSVDMVNNLPVFSENLVLENLLPENQEVGFQEVENREDNIIYNNKKLNNIIYNNQSINQSNKSKKEIDGLMDIHTAAENYNEYKELIKENIEYDIISKRDYDKEQLEEIVNIMAEIVAFSHKTVRINGNDIPAEIVKNRFLKINSSDIEYILDTLSANTTKIHNIRAYLITTIYNAKDTINHYYQAEVRHDLYGCV